MGSTGDIIIKLYFDLLAAGVDYLGITIIIDVCFKVGLRESLLCLTIHIRA